jgi:threonine dehydrogenase-like Zn-dependent dehydrogenase
MKAFFIWEPGKVTMEEIAEPHMGHEDVLIEVRYLGLCGSDLNSFRGLMPLVKFPRIPGHEISGVIIDKGSSVPDSLKKGDFVTVLPYTNCKVCPACRAGRPNTCQYNQTLGVQRDGALTERIAVHYENIHISKLLSLKELVLVEPFSVGYHAINRGHVNENDLVAILGCGTIGMGALCASIRKGATVIGIDIDDSKLKLAKKFGAQYIINASKDNITKMIASITINEGVNVAVESAGTPDTLATAIDIVCYAGRVVTIGYSKQDAKINSQLIVKKELDIYGSRNALRVFPAVISMFEKKEKPYTDLITKIFPFKNTAEAFKYWDENTSSVSKILIEM